MQNRKRRAAQLEQRSSISPGSKVLLTSGFIGTLLSKDGDQAEVELAPGLTVRVLATAIARTLPDEGDAADAGTPGRSTRAPSRRRSPPPTPRPPTPRG